MRVPVSLLSAALLAAISVPAFGQAPENGAAPATTQPAAGPAAEKTPAILCPVTGEPIDRAVYMRFRGKRVYFANQDALEAFRTKPYGYAEATKKQWELLRPSRLQVRCPVTGEPVDTKIFVELPERDLYFATEAAREKWQAKPERYHERLERCYVYQSTCGLCDGEPKPDVHDEFDGLTIYFCCPGCMGAFAEHRDKFIDGVRKEIDENRRRWDAEHSPAPNDAATKPSIEKKTPE